jgi:DNA-binding NtrC family response regulator
MRLLIIDDEPHIRQMMRLTLEVSGYDVDEAASGEDGLARFGDGRAHDAVLLDQRMPGLDGLETLRRLKTRAPDARVLMVSAFASVELAVDAMKLGAGDFLRKPMTPDRLRGAVAAMLREARSPTLARARPSVATLTLNGFQISRADDERGRGEADHCFRVRHPDGAQTAVVVTIGGEAVARVRRLTQRDLRPDGGFWRVQAERALAAYLWSEGEPPPAGQLILRDVSRDDLDVALAWPAD